MAFGIMRCEKRKAQTLGGIEAENNRSVEINLPASDINWEKTNENIWLVRTNNWNAAIKDYLHEHGIDKHRKDAVLAIDTLYTASPAFLKSLSKEETLDFFKDCLDFHQQEFGHVINAVIHMDESTPHCHVVSIPLVETDSGGYKLSAKELMGNRSDYHARQDRFFEEVSSKWDLDRGEIRDPVDRRKHLDVLDYKLEQRNIELEAKTDDVEALKEKAGQLLDLKEDLQNAVEEVKVEHEATALELASAKNNLENAKKELSGLKKIRNLISDVAQIFREKISILIDKIERVVQRIEHLEPVSEKDLTNNGLTVRHYKEDRGVLCDAEDAPLTWQGYELNMEGRYNYKAVYAFNSEVGSDRMLISAPKDLSSLLSHENRDFDVSQFANSDLEYLRSGVDKCFEIGDQIKDLETSYDDAVGDDYDPVDFGL